MPLTLLLRPQYSTNMENMVMPAWGALEMGIRLSGRGYLYPASRSSPVAGLKGVRTREYSSNESECRPMPLISHGGYTSRHLVLPNDNLPRHLVRGSVLDHTYTSAKVWGLTAYCLP
jgi:hypothetical protein